MSAGLREWQTHQLNRRLTTLRIGLSVLHSLPEAQRDRGYARQVAELEALIAQVETEIERRTGKKPPVVVNAKIAAIKLGTKSE